MWLTSVTAIFEPSTPGNRDQTNIFRGMGGGAAKYLQRSTKDKKGYDKNIIKNATIK